MFQLEKNTQILDVEQICLPTGEFDQIQYVAAYFLEGKTPESWKDFQEDECNWASLPLEKARLMSEELNSAITDGNVCGLCLGFEPWGEDYFLSVEFDQGWASMLYNAIDECCAAPCDPERPDGLEEAPVDIGGQTPVPKMCAVERLEKAAQIVLCLLETGGLSAETKWAVNTEGGLPWEF